MIALYIADNSVFVGYAVWGLCLVVINFIVIFLNLVDRIRHD